MKVKITIPGTPAAKGRPRAFSTPMGARMYTPEKTRDAAEEAAIYARLAMRLLDPISGPVSVSMLAVFPCPKKWSKARLARNAEVPEWHIAKPDMDNVAKLVFDAFNGIVWHDDSQVAHFGEFEKVYGSEPRVEITVSSL